MRRALKTRQLSTVRERFLERLRQELFSLEERIREAVEAGSEPSETLAELIRDKEDRAAFLRLILAHSDKFKAWRALLRGLLKCWAFTSGPERIKGLSQFVEAVDNGTIGQVLGISPELADFFKEVRQEIRAQGIPQ